MIIFNHSASFVLRFLRCKDKFFSQNSKAEREKNGLGIKVLGQERLRFYGSPANNCVRFTKTSKTPLMMSVAFGPTSCSSGLVPKSMLLHRPESHDGFVPKHCHHGGKNHALQAKRQD
jgi:hypothetical protein